MLPFIKETLSVWQRILAAARAAKPILLYGTGDAAQTILERCQALGATPSGIFASDERVRYQNFHGFTVKKYAELRAEFGPDLFIIIAFASELKSVLAQFQRLMLLHPGQVVAPHLALFGSETVTPAWLEKYAEPLSEVYARLADDASRRVFAAALNYKISGDARYLEEVSTPRRAALASLELGSDETYYDLGAYDGDTVREFLELTGGRYRQIIAAEPDRRNLRKLRAYTLAAKVSRIRIYAGGVWSARGVCGFTDQGGRAASICGSLGTSVPVTTIDSLAQEAVPSYIKMDLEGSEKQALLGAQQTLARYAPKLFLAAYHRDNDLFQLPLYLWQLVPGYQIRLFKSPCLPCWELNFCCRLEGH